MTTTAQQQLYGRRIQSQCRRSLQLSPNFLTAHKSEFNQAINTMALFRYSAHGHCMLSDSANAVLHLA